MSKTAKDVDESIAAISLAMDVLQKHCRHNEENIVRNESLLGSWYNVRCAACQLTWVEDFS